MKSRYLVNVFASALLSIPTLGLAAELKVVTSFSVLNDLVQEVGGEHISLTNLVEANGDAHVYQPSPMDAQAVAEADLLVVNGLGFEGWMERLEQSAGFKGVKIAATDGVNLIHLGEEDEHHEEEGHHDEDEHHDEEGHHDEDEHHDEKGHHDEDEHHDEKGHHDEDGHHDEEEHHDDEEEHHADEHHHHHGEFDPHAWHSVTNVLVYVENIRAALVKLAPEHAAEFNQNAKDYVKELKALEKDLAQKMSQVPENKRNVITSHDAFGYLAREYGFNFTAPQGMSTEAEASAADVVKIIKQIRKDDIQAVFVEKVSNSRLIEQIARETGAKIGGELYADALSSPNQAAGTYIKMMEHNISTLVKALSN
jgi:zinc/manganese transport system substrate-binding protein